jgi:hypothetical protein
MGPFPRPERQSDEPDSHEKPSWPWEKSSTEKVAKDKSDNPKPDTKNKPGPKKEQKPEAKKDEPAEKKTDEEEKHERRSTLIEQSIALVAKYEEEPIPRDATTLARLMIAHHVVHLNNQLEQPEPGSDLGIKEIEATLDYIARLDEKFQDPASSLDPEVEQSYQDIIELAEATLEETPDLAVIVRDFAQTDTQSTANKSDSSPGLSQENKPEDWAEQEFSRRKTAAHDTLPAVATAAALIYAVTHLGKRKKLVPQPAETVRDSDTGPAADAGPSSVLQSTTQETMRTEQSAAMPLRSERMTPPRNEYVPVPPRRLSPHLAATAFTTSVVASRSTGSETSRPSLTPDTHSTSTPFAKTPPESSRSEHEPSQPEQHSGSSRKIEFLSLPQLLTMAETISLGQGRYLRHEFEAGHIDKEGLVKILKSHAKGLDYQFEFRQQADQFANLKTTSPEFLHQTTFSDTPADKQATDMVAPQTTESTPTPLNPVSKPLSLAPPASHDVLPDLPGNNHKPQNTTKRLLIITGLALAGLTLVGWLALSAFNALG